MSVKYEIVPATQQHAEELADTMRQADRDEVWAACRFTPLQALEVSLVASPDAKAGLADGRVVCMFGVSAPTVLSDVGVPWLLGADELPKHSRAFLRRNRAYIAALKARYKLLVNYVDDRHAEAIRWLKWLGFTLFPAEPYGAEQLLFRRFEMRN